MTVADVFGQQSNIRNTTRKNRAVPYAIMVGGRHWSKNPILVATLIMFLVLIIISKDYFDFQAGHHALGIWEKYILASMFSGILSLAMGTVGVDYMLERLMGVERMNVIEFKHEPSGNWELKPSFSETIRLPLYEEEAAERNLIARFPPKGTYYFGKHPVNPRLAMILIGRAPYNVENFFRHHGHRRVVRPSRVSAQEWLAIIGGGFLPESNIPMIVNSERNTVENIVSHDDLRTGNLVVAWPGRDPKEILTPISYDSLVVPKTGPLTGLPIRTAIVKPLRVRKVGGRRTKRRVRRR
jgi:hypothetical protein